MKKEPVSTFTPERTANFGRAEPSEPLIGFKQDVDFVVGAQYGDEGKGMVAKLVADHVKYAWTARTGAQNAEHRFIHGGCEFCARILPSACAFRPDIIAVLGAGHCFMPEQLLLETVHLGIEPDRIIVDPHAMWLKPEHAEVNLATGNIRGTTGWGVGAAIAEKVRRQLGTQLIGDSEILAQAGVLCSRPVPQILQELKGPGLVEGSQGAMLSLDHGRYPYCTAKNVSVPAIAGELGLGLKRVRKVIGVVRLVFMRVPGPSGPTGGEETSFDAVEDRTGLRLPHHKRLQGDTTRWQASEKPDKAEEERLFDLSMDELRFTHYLNNYDYLAVTFTDYHRAGNYRVLDWSRLHEDTRKLINQLESDIAPVLLIRTGQGEYDNIWLREVNWC